MKKLVFVVAVLACAFAAVAEGSSGGAIVFPILNLGF